MGSIYMIYYSIFIEKINPNASNMQNMLEKETGATMKLKLL